MSKSKNKQKNCWVASSVQNIDMDNNIYGGKRKMEPKLVGSQRKRHSQRNVFMGIESIGGRFFFFNNIIFFYKKYI
jgi:hypothetical protein